MSFSEKVYRFLLSAYPCDYHGRYAEPMAQLFRDRLREMRSLIDLAALWGRTLADWAISVPARYWERVERHTTLLADSKRRCILFARLEASSFSSGEITIEHSLLGVLREEPSLLPATAREFVVRAIESNEPAGRRIPPMEDLKLSDEAMRVVEAAKEISRRAGRDEVATADVAAAILREKDTLAERLLRQYSADSYWHQT